MLHSLSVSGQTQLARVLGIGKPGRRAHNCYLVHIIQRAAVAPVSRECWAGGVGQRLYLLPVGAPHWQVSLEDTTEQQRCVWAGIHWCKTVGIKSTQKNRRGKISNNGLINLPNRFYNVGSRYKAYPQNLFL